MNSYLTLTDLCPIITNIVLLTSKPEYSLSLTLIFLHSSSCIYSHVIHCVYIRIA